MTTGFLNHSLLETWSNYEKQVRRSRREISTKNIHKLRISTQRLEAILKLVSSLKSNHNIKNVIFLIKKVRKNLGPLRDIQVEAMVLKDLKDNKFGKKSSQGFASFFSGKKATAKEKAVTCLDEISLRHERHRIRKLAKRIIEIEDRKTKSQIESELNRKIRSSLEKLNRMMTSMDPKRVKDIHRFRIRAKKLRYQGEFLNALNGSMILDLNILKQAQSVAGRIQNDSVSLGTLEQFLSKKKHSTDPRVLAVRKRIQNNQANLIDKDFKKLTALKWRTLN
ncbi:MAG: hypothetical protein B7Y39_11610 [Bdellovibrio sp. 28-41-41]|nr:MAG: hypothetical protein B7Y39_11610 [Bdellovibrio sp. 28-41-41]